MIVGKRTPSRLCSAPELRRERVPCSFAVGDDSQVALTIRAAAVEDSARSRAPAQVSRLVSAAAPPRPSPPGAGAVV